MPDEPKATTDDDTRDSDAADDEETSNAPATEVRPRTAVQGLAMRAAGHATRMLSEQIKQPLTYVEDAVGELRRLSERLPRGVASPHLDRLATQLEQLASGAGDLDAAELVAKVQSFARRKPVAFLGATVGVGFIAARFIKSSAQASTTRGARAVEVAPRKSRRRPRRTAETNAN